MKKLILSMLAISAMVSCSKTTPEQQELGNTTEPIAFGSSILADVNTKAPAEGATQFAVGDKINVIGFQGAAVPTTDFTGSFIDNVEYEFTAANNFKTPAPTYYWKRGEKHYFYAYYLSTTANAVYAAGTASAAPQIAVTVAAGTGIGNDLMGAAPVINTEAYVKQPATGNLCALAFTHKLSKVKFAIKKESAEVPNSELSELSFTMASNEATYNVVTGIFGALTAAPVVLTKTGLTQSVATTTATTVPATEWLVLPGDGISTITATIDGQTIAVTGLTANLTTEPGKMTTITLTLKGNEIVFTSSITAWSDSTQPGVGDID